MSTTVPDIYPAFKKSRWKQVRKALGSVYDVGGGLIGHFDASHVWGRYGGEFGSYKGGIVSDRRGEKVGIVRQSTLVHEVHGIVAHCRNGNFVFPAGKPAGRYTGDEDGAAATFLLHFHRQSLRKKQK